MNSIALPSTVEIQNNSPVSNPCFAYAIAEISRLLKKSRTDVLVAPPSYKSRLYHVFIGLPGTRVPATGRFPSDLFPDAFALSVSAKGVSIASTTAKGILNGVYDLAERLGFAFLLPGEDGEWAPESLRRLPIGRTISNPRFRHRGIQFGGLTYDFELAEWLVFYAKLRFNAVCLHGPSLSDTSMAQRLGLRLETGGHGYRDLLPRKLFGRRPELFRMMQPEDFGGKRVSDFNSCVANPEARAIMRESYRKEVRQADRDGFYSLHRWPDDLPGGGWCLCPHCRGIAPSDQGMLAMRNLGEVVREEGLPMRVAMVAYHDTMLPAGDIAPTKDTFLLFAPRERCYGHRLDDPTCARNKFYMRALVEWMQKYKGINDAHTCEYYCDQILFRGLHPYTPDVIAGDSDAYERCGIEAHMVLHIAGTAVSPDWNMLFLAHNFWDATLTSKTFDAAYPRLFCDGAAAFAWSRYLDARARIFTKALRMCDHEINVYLDYRWLPGTTKAFGSKMVEVYRQSSKALAIAWTALEKAVSSQGSPRLQSLMIAEIARARFEVAELAVMSHQQDSVDQATRYLVSNNPSLLQAAISSGENVIRGFRPARALAKKAGISEKCWYFNNINRWLSNETKGKIRVWKNGLNTRAAGTKGKKKQADPMKQPPLSLHLCDELELADSSWDRAIREALCDCFAPDAAAFARSRAWHGSTPDFAVFLADGPRVMAHVAIVSREVVCGDVLLRVAGLQGVCVRPEMRGRHLLDDILARAMEEARRRGLDLGLLFCVPEIEKVYFARGWRRIPNDPIICLDENHREEPLPGKNIAMAYSLRLAEFPAGPLHLQGRDW